MNRSQKRHITPKSWPVARKGTAYVVKAAMSPHKGVPILVALRDILRIASNKREVRQAIHSKNILLNDKRIKDEKNTVQLYDVLTNAPAKKHYRLTFKENGRYDFKEVKGKDAEQKVAKIIGKKTLPKKKVQLNLSDGNNFLTKEQYQTNDSIVLNLKKRAIEKVLPLKEGAQVLIFSGKHAGKTGSIHKIDKKQKNVELKVGKENINVLIKQIMVIQ